jgi:outer membrane protein OmpA-like peptidoglycan-associated protein
MDDRQPRPLRNRSRTLAMVAVAVLIVIAIAGIVLAGMRSRVPPAGAGAADPTQAGAPPPTGTAGSVAAGAEDAPAGPNQIVFAPGSDKLSEVSASKLMRFAETVRKQGRGVVIAGRIESRPDRTDQMELAKNRAFAVRQMLQSNGVPVGAMRVDIAELPLGLVPANEANRFDVAMR